MGAAESTAASAETVAVKNTADASTNSGSAHISTATPLPAGWKQLVDPKSGHFYYGHAETGHVQWERPTGPPQVKQVRAPTQAERAAAVATSGTTEKEETVPQPAAKAAVAAAAAPVVSAAQQPVTQGVSNTTEANSSESSSERTTAVDQEAAATTTSASSPSSSPLTPTSTATASTGGGFWNGVGTVLSYVPIVNLVVPGPAAAPAVQDPAASSVWTHLVEYTLQWLEDGRVQAWNKEDVMLLVLGIPRKNFKEYVMHVAKAAKEERKKKLTSSNTLVEVETGLSDAAGDERSGSELTLAQQLLEIDGKLSKLRHYLVPRHVHEEEFWQEYFKEVKIRIGGAVKGQPVKEILSHRKAFFVSFNQQAAASSASVDPPPTQSPAT